MATFKCPDCKTKVSTSATACPKCGRPVTASDKQPKKPSKAKKLLVLFVCLVVAGAWLNARHPEGILPQNTNSTTGAKNLSPDCEKIKTVKDWEQADTFWRIGHEECRPKAPEYNYTWTQKDIETFIKKSLPTYSKLGGYKLVPAESQIRVSVRWKTFLMRMEP